MQFICVMLEYAMKTAIHFLKRWSLFIPFVPSIAMTVAMAWNVHRSTGIWRCSTWVNNYIFRRRKQRNNISDKNSRLNGGTLIVPNCQCNMVCTIAPNVMYSDANCYFICAILSMNEFSNCLGKWCAILCQDWPYKPMKRAS